MATASAMAWLNSSSGGGASRCRAQVSAGAAMGRADLGDWMVAADDGDRLAAFDGIEQVREMPGCLGCGHGLHKAILSDNQIHCAAPGHNRTARWINTAQCHDGLSCR